MQIDRAQPPDRTPDAVVPAAVVRRAGRLLRVHLATALVLAAAFAPEAFGQGTGSAGGQVLQLPAGARAAALSGAYTAAAGDADVIFYNPAGAAGTGTSVGFAYQRYVEDVATGSLSAAVRVGPLAVGVGAVYLDAGDIDVIEPDPEFGFQRGRETGAVVSAGESAGRVVIAAPLAGGRLRLGAAAGYLSSDLAGQRSNAFFADLGAQFAHAGAAFGIALLHAGGSLRGTATRADPLPTEARAGATVDVLSGGGAVVTVAADVRARLRERTTGFAAGIEAGLRPDGDGGAGAVARIGYATDRGAGELLGAVQAGAGLSLGPWSLDYAYQRLRHLGDAHRVGLRWRPDRW